MSDKIIPFGKYKGQPIEVLAQDEDYRNWLLNQNNIKKQYPQIVNLIYNNFQEPTETPEHNKLQALFLDNVFCYQFFVKSTMVSKKDSNLNWFLDRKHNRFELVDTVKDYSLNKSFETNGIDVTISISLTFDNLYNPKPDEEGEYMVWQKDSKFSQSIKVEIKPLVGDDYPAVLRQMKLSKSHVLFIGEYNGVGVSETDFIRFFRNEMIKVVFLRDMKPYLKIEEAN